MLDDDVATNFLPPVLDDDIGTKDPEEETTKASEATVNVRITTPEEYANFHQAERTQWLEEAKEDFVTADNLRPPGISVPCKLAHTQMELGNISEALTILTDLKNKSQLESENIAKAGKRHRTELERSFAAWLLYADLMLIIGHECKQWNRGIHTNENYMFRRWLRKYCDTFHWQERRCQALCMALEAAAGTKACEKLMLWIQERTHQMRSNDGEKQEDESRWQVCDTYEMDRQIQQAKATPEKSEKPSDNSGQEEQNHEEEKVDEESSEKLPSKGAGNDSARSPDIGCSFPLENLTATFNLERSELLATNKTKLSDFDNATKEMNLKTGSTTSTKREEERELIVKSQKESIFSLAGKYQEQKADLIREQTAEDTNDNSNTKVNELPMSAPCATVCDIAAQLVKQCLAMNLHSGGRLGAEAVSLYLQERAYRYEERMSKWRSFEERQAFNGKSVLQLDKESYDTVSCNCTFILCVCLI